MGEKITWDRETQTTNTGVSEEEYLATLTEEERRAHYETGQHNGTYNPYATNPAYKFESGSGGLMSLDYFSGGNDYIGYSPTQGSLGDAIYRHGTNTPQKRQNRAEIYEAWYDVQPQRVTRSDTAKEMNFFPTDIDPVTLKPWNTMEARPFYNHFHEWFAWKVSQENDWKLWENKDVEGAEFTQIDSVGNVDGTRMGTHDNNPDHDKAFISIPFGIENATGIEGNFDRPANADDLGLEGGFGEYDQFPNRPDEIEYNTGALRKEFFSNPIVKAIQVFGGPVANSIITGFKATSNQEISPMEWASATLGYLELGGAVDSTAATATEAGTGLGNLSYAQTEKLIKAAASDDLQDAVVGQFSDELADIAMGGLESAGITEDTFNTDFDTFKENVGDVVTDWAGGDSFKDALTSNLGGEAVGIIQDYLPDVDVPDFKTPEIVKDVGDVVVDVLEPPLEFVGETFEPLIESGEQVLSTAEDVLEPVKEVVETIGEPIVDVVDEIGDTIDSPLGDLLKGALGGIGGTGGMISGVGQPTQVEGIFDKELFKFDTEIKSTQEMLSPMMNLRRYG